MKIDYNCFSEALFTGILFKRQIHFKKVYYTIIPDFTQQEDLAVCYQNLSKHYKTTKLLWMPRGRYESINYAKYSNQFMYFAFKEFIVENNKLYIILTQSTKEFVEKIFNFYGLDAICLRRIQGKLSIVKINSNSRKDYILKIRDEIQSHLLEKIVLRKSLR
ncbi:MAG: hypothetical protein QW139_02970 [Candidatus Micrarchaeaceae archaeon]